MEQVVEDVLSEIAQVADAQSIEDIIQITSSLARRLGATETLLGLVDLKTGDLIEFDQPPKLKAAMGLMVEQLFMVGGVARTILLTGASLEWGTAMKKLPPEQKKLARQLMNVEKAPYGILVPAQPHDDQLGVVSFTAAERNWCDDERSRCLRILAIFAIGSLSKLITRISGDQTGTH